MKIIPVTCAIIHLDNKILAVQRSETMKLPLKWEFAGGKIEEGETEVECIKREIYEELNITIRINQRLTPVIHEYSDFKIELIPFTADYVSGELKLREHCNSVFANKEQLINLDWADADLPILKEFLAL